MGKGGGGVQDGGVGFKPKHSLGSPIKTCD